MFKIVAISDSHNKHNAFTRQDTPVNLPEGDLLVHSGDLTSHGYKHEVQDVLKWLRKVACRYTYGVVFIAGNHDRSFDPKHFRDFEDHDLWDEYSHLQKPSWLREEIEHAGNRNVYYLENSEIEFGGLKFWGSPYTPWFRGDYWGFNRHRGEAMGELWQSIPPVDVLITHGPPAYKCDYIPRSSEYAGCAELRERVKEIKPLVHIFGHIHESYGRDYDEHTHYVNAAIVGQGYQVANKPWEIEINTETREVDIY